METGVDVWIRDTSGNLGWMPAIVQSKVTLSDGKLQIVARNDRGEDFEYQVDDAEEEHNDLKLRNSDADSDVENLIKLPYLHEPAILYCLEQRYHKSDIYTYTGPILIAVNPFKKVNLYSPQILETYYNTGLLKSQGIDSSPLPPHVYAIADAAYREMMKAIFAGTASANQSILISGESGAGKTESTKIVLKYLTTVGNSTGSLDMVVGSVMDKILQSNPILEAFGNARTLRNDNSSRFGKFIELNFNRRGHLVGGTIRTYLLEKVRLPKQQVGERNFHIFYQMIKGGSPEELAEWQLTSLPYFFYTNQGGIYDLRHIDDKEEFKDMKNALNILNFDRAEQLSLLRALAALLHLGQLQFVPDGDEGCVLSSADDCAEHARIASELCGLDVAALIKTLTIRMIVTREETFEKKMTAAQAADARDAFTKAIYGKIFDWIVETINKSIQVDAKLIRADIGVLDIFGFECFKQNSFEQLCINYTNEALQQQFNQYVFKMEQQEYQQEHIEWSFIEFPDNQDCLQLIEHKQNGILAMVDDECKLPKATDDKLASRMYKSLESHNRFTATPAQKRDLKFCIKHYAGPVIYTVTTFVEKNKDELPKESASLLQASNSVLLAKLFTPPPTAPAPVPVPGKPAAKSGSSGVQSVSAQFKDQLNKLMEKIYSTTPHYIRCLKPNDENLADNFNRLRTTEQLRYGGVLEAVRVARSGFPVRLSHVDFFARYRPLSNPFNAATAKLPRTLSQLEASAAKKLCDDLMDTLFDETIGDSDSSSSPAKKTLTRRMSRMMELTEWKGKMSNARSSVQLGLTKVFLRKQAHDILEARRTRRLASATKKLQAIVRGYLVKRRYMITRVAAIVIQRYARGLLARILAWELQQERAATIVQRHIRRYMAQIRFAYFKWAVIRVQSRFRGRKSRVETAKLCEAIYTLRLQRISRGLMARRKYQQFRRSVIALQCKLRQRRAKNSLRELRAAAKDLGRLQQTNDSLKAEIEMLRAQAMRAQLEVQQRVEREASEAREREVAELQNEIIKLKQQLKEESRLRKEAEDALRTHKENINTANIDHTSSSDDFAPHTPVSTNKASSRSNSLRKSYAPSHFIAPEDTVDIADFRRLQDDLGKERAANNELSEEVARLRKLWQSSNVQDSTVKRRMSTIAKGPIHNISMVSDDNTSSPDHSYSKQQYPPSRSGSMNKGDISSPIIHSDNIVTSGTNPMSRPRRSLKANSAATLSQENVSAVTTTTTTSSSTTSITSIFNNNNTNDDKFAEAWEKDDDDEDDGSDTESRSSASDKLSLSSTISTVSSASSVPSAMPVTGTFVKKNQEELKYKANLDKLKDTFIHKGVAVKVWDGRISKHDTILKLDSAGQKLTFNAPQSAIYRPMAIMSMFSKEILPVKLSDIFECIAGGDITPAMGDSSCFVTIVTRGDTAPRILALKVDTKEERNQLANGIRTLMNDINNSTDSALEAQVTAMIGNNSAANVSNQQPQHSQNAPSHEEPPKSEVKVTHTRRMTIRESILEDKTVVSGVNISHHNPGVQPRAMPSRRPSMRTHANAASSTTSASYSEEGASDKMKMLLVQEKTSNEKLRNQIMQLTNDINDRDSQIASLKKSELELSSTIANKDKIYDQDAKVRMQLGTRLQQVLMDKEDLQEKVESLEEELAELKEAMRLMSEQKSA